MGVLIFDSIIQPPVNHLRWAAPVQIGNFSDTESRGQRGEWGAMCHSDLEGVPDVDDETYLDLVNKGYFRTSYCDFAYKAVRPLKELLL